MTLIKSISGIRGTIGGFAGENLTPLDVLKFSLAFAQLMKEKQQKQRLTMVVGRDARISGEMISRIVVAALQSIGCDVIDIGLTTTPTIEMSIVKLRADAGVMLTASHNPFQWNALKLLNGRGEFIDAEEGERLLELSEKTNVVFSDTAELGTYFIYENAIDDHISAILALPLVDVKAIKTAGFSVVIDCVNSTGSIAIPKLLKALGVETIHRLYCEPNGNFPHNPEPLPEHLTEISRQIQDLKSDIGFVVDPDVDRLVIINSDGSMFGEEYTLVAVADYILQNTPGNTVSNMSSTRALRDITEKAGKTYYASAVGEVNVVVAMKAHQAVIGGEGNGGVIYPELHYGRDALVGIALILSFLAKEKQTSLQLKQRYPQYVISKNKKELDPCNDVNVILKKIADRYSHLPHSLIDGVKIEFENNWVHLRKSNTEPIIRIYAEAANEEEARALAQKIISDIETCCEE